MNYCKKCNKAIEQQEETYKGLCLNCYREYLFEKINHIGDEEYEAEFSSGNNLKTIIDSIKKFFQKK